MPRWPFRDGRNYFVVLVEPDFVVSDEDGALLLDEEDDGVLLEPAPAVPLGLELELDGLVLDEDEDDPPLALSFLFRSIEVEDELEPEGAVLGAAVVPLADEDEEPGVAVEPDGEVVEDELEERSAPRSHAVISVAPRAIETATASVDILMGPPWLGYWKRGANIGPLVSSSSSAGCRSTWDLCCRRSTGSPAADRRASGRPAPASGSSPRAFPQPKAGPNSPVSWKSPRLRMGEPTTCRFSATAW